MATPKDINRIDQMLASSAEGAAAIVAFYKTLREELKTVHREPATADAVALQLTQSWLMSIAMSGNRDSK